MNKYVDKIIIVILVIALSFVNKYYGLLFFIFVIVYREVIKKMNGRYYNDEVDDDDDDQQSTDHVIPLHIYQTYWTKSLPPNMNNCVETLKKQNPEFVHHLYDDNDCRQFIKNNYNDVILNAYNALVPGAYKADLWRYCVLYKKGGVYIDIKFKCADGVKLINMVDKEYFVEDLISEGEMIGVYNGCMICKKGNKNLLQAINQIVENIENNYYGENALAPTGPVLLGKIVTYDEFKNIQLRFVSDLVNYGKLNESHYIINKTTNQKLFVMYPEYRKDQNDYKESHPHYGKLWYSKQIYKK